MLDDILSYRELCEKEDAQTLQRGMNFRLNPNYSVVLMSRKNNAPYQDKILSDGITIEYQGHDEPQSSTNPDPKLVDQPFQNRKSWTLTQNGRFIQSINNYKSGKSWAEIVRVYEKILSGVRSLKWFFDLIDYRIEVEGQRNVFIFTLRLSKHQELNKSSSNLQHTRLIPSEIKKEVWKRDWWKCVLCGSQKNLHFDHDLPFSRGGTSLTSKNIKLLCMNCNLKKSNKIE